MPEQLDLDFWANMNERYPYFQHKKAQEALRLADLQYPPWVAGEMATMAPGTVQLEQFCRESEDGNNRQRGKVMQLFLQVP